ncbi:clasp N terminal-domain-containing protein [Mrakia frigida]|uniref:clasp N terminal-domain-containing protein n=1 Tax=Mrakia frigida TaxID=29902 RepID=UPI003FCC238D
MPNLPLDGILSILAKPTSDLDSKQAALASLKDILQETDQLPERVYDSLTLGIKTSFRQINAPLALATLLLLPRYLTLMADSDDLQRHLHLLTSSLLPPSHGLVDRLGDGNLRIRDAAREVLVELGILVFNERGKVVAEAEAMGSKDVKEVTSEAWEAALKEQGFKSKNPRMREQSILIIAAVRARNSALRLSMFTTILVSLLEDADGQVRETARESIITMFSAPITPPRAKADLKKQLLAQDVRKAFVDIILPLVLGDPATHVRIEPTEGVEEIVPVDEGAIDIDIVYIASERDLEAEFARMVKVFEGKEDEKNWAGREVSMERVRGMLLGKAFIKYPEVFVRCLRSGWMEGSLKGLVSLRTSVSTSTCECYLDLVTQLGQAFDPLVETVLLPLSRTTIAGKPVIIQQTQQVLESLLRLTSPFPRLVIPMLAEGAAEKNLRAREYAAHHFKTFIDTHGTKSKQLIESSPGGLVALEKILRALLQDANNKIKVPGRLGFWSYHSVWPEAGTKLMASLDPPTRKQLESVNPHPARVAGPPRSSGLGAQVAAKRKALALQRQAEAAAAAAIPSTSSSSSPSTSAPPPPSSPTSQASTSRKTHVSPALPIASTSSSRSTSPLIRPTPLVARASSPPSRSPIHPLAQTQRSTPSSPFGHQSPTPKPLRAEGGRPSAASMPDQGSLLSQEELVSPFSQHSHQSDSGSNFDQPQSPSTPIRSGISKPIDLKAETPVQSSSLENHTVPEEEIRSQAEQAVSTAQTLTEVGEHQKQQDFARQDQESSFSNGAGRSSNSNLGLLHPSKTNGAVGTTQQSSPHTPIKIMRGAVMYQDSPQAVPNSKLEGWRKKMQREPSTFLLFTFFQLVPIPPSLNSADTLTSFYFSLHFPSPELDNATQPGSSTASSLPSDALEALASGSSTLLDFQALFHFSDQHSSPNLASVSSSSGAGSSSQLSDESGPMSPWGGISNETEDAFRKTFDTLLIYLDSELTPPHLDTALYVLEALLENQNHLTEGHEATICRLLWKLRSAGEGFDRDLKLATHAVFVTLLAHSTPVFLLNTVADSLRNRTASEAANGGQGLVFGLLALGLCCKLLAPQIIEDVLPALQDILLPALNAPNADNLNVRQYAAVAILACQLVLRDETLLFTLLPQLTMDNKNSLTYHFDKHRVREGSGTGGEEKVSKEIRRLSLSLS